MKRTLKIISFLATFFLFNLSICQAQHELPLEVVKLFDKVYGGPLMDEIAEHTTAKFRDNKPKSVWIVDTWKTLRQIKYQRLNSSVIVYKVKGGRAVVVAEARIKTVAGEAVQKEIF